MVQQVERLISNNHTEEYAFPQNAFVRLKRIFTLGIVIFAAICIALILLTVRLGFWQLERAVYHQSIIDQSLKARSVAVSVKDHLNDSQQFQLIAIDGIWLDRSILIDSQVANGQIGYHLLQLFELANKQAIWIDRGFLPVEDRTLLPDIKTPNTTRVIGEYYHSPKWVTAKAYVEPMAENVSRVSSYTDHALAELGTEQTVQGVLRLIEADSAQLQANWPVVSVDPNKNRAYAVQWFAIAAALMLAISIFLWHNIGENNKDVANGDGNKT